MSALGAGFGRLFGEHKSFADQLRAVEHAAGSATAAAREVGVHRTTWTRWVSGKTRAPKAEAQRRVGITARMASLGKSVPNDQSVKLSTAEPTGRRRVIKGTNLRVRPGTMAKTLETWVETGNKEQTASVFRRGVGDEFYRDQYLRADTDPGDSVVVPHTIEIS